MNQPTNHPAPRKYAAVVYSRPDCMRCHVTLRALTRMGVHCVETCIDDHEDVLTMMQNLHWTQLPLVEVTTPSGDTQWWCGMNTAELDALRRRIKEQS